MRFALAFASRELYGVLGTGRPHGIRGLSNNLCVIDHWP